MKTARLLLHWAIWASAAVTCAGAVVSERWGAKGVRCAHGGAVKVVRSGQTVRIEVDLSDLPEGAGIRRADLRVFRTAELTGRDDEALVSIDIRPAGEPALKLRGPWYDRLDATEAARKWAAGARKGRFDVAACPKWDEEATCLDVEYDGAPARGRAQVKSLTVTHRAGQTFIVFGEIDDRSAEAALTWGVLRKRLERVDAERTVRYRIYRHDRPITADSLVEAELLGEAKPMSGYNARGRSVDQLIALHRRRAIDDMELAKRLARENYFDRYHPDMPEMAEVAIQRLAIRTGKPLPPRMGLYVHHPAKAGRAYYAVVAVVDGTASTGDFSPANSLAEPVVETVGPGRPVLQGLADVTVFYDYPGKRFRYVQWAGPPRAHLPNQYYNWGVFVPRGREAAQRRRLSVFFHDARRRFLKPPWPHRQDTVLLSPHDGPYRSFGYGWHEALGTLRSFRQGKVRPFFARRVDAMLEWAISVSRADAERVSCGGSGYWGGTAALQYGLRRPGRIAYVMADNSPDADPRQTPYEYSHYGRGDKRKTRRANVEAVWGRPEWNLPCEEGGSIWDHANLPAFVRSVGDRRTLPFVSLGAGSMHLTWKQETDLMKALLATRNAFMAEFFWGGKAHKPLPVSAESGDWPFEPRSDRPLLACDAKQRHPNPKFFEAQFATGRRGYGAGSRLNTRPRWDGETIVDEPDRLEMTIYSARRVVYAGRVTCAVTIRNTHKFRPAPGRALQWSLTDAKTKKPRGGGAAKADEHGRIVIDAIEFAAPARLVVRPANGSADKK